VGGEQTSLSVHPPLVPALSPILLGRCDIITMQERIYYVHHIHFVSGHNPLRCVCLSLGEEYFPIESAYYNFITILFCHRTEELA